MNDVTPQRLFEMAWGFAPALTIKTATEVAVFDALAAGPRTADDIAESTNCSSRGMRIMLDALGGFGLLAKVDGAYRLTPESEAFLVSSQPGYLGPIFQHFGATMLPDFLSLTECVRRGEPVLAVNDQRSGAPFFEKFVEALFPVNAPSAGVLARHLALANDASVLDVAAGSGVWGITLAKSAQGVRVTAVDWPNVLEITRRVAASYGVADRFTFAPGDLLEADFGDGHQVATLGQILHTEGEERSRALLRRVQAALSSVDWVPQQMTTAAVPRKPTISA